MSLYRIAVNVLLTASLLWISACDTSTGSLISEEVKDLLAPPVSTTENQDTGLVAESNTDATNPQIEDPRTNNTSAPLVTSVSPTVTIRGSTIVLLIHGENLSSRLSVHLDNEPNPCEVSELGNTRNGIVQTNLIEAACTTRSISERVLKVTDSSGNEITGSPITFTGTNISLSTSASKSVSTVNSDSSTISSHDTLSNTYNSTSISNPFAASTVSATNDDLATAIQTTLPAPTNVHRLVDSTDFIKLSWDAVESAQGYNVYVSNTPNPQAGVRGTDSYISYSPSLQLTDFTVDQTLYIVVTAFSNNLESMGSAELRVDMPAALDRSADGRYSVFTSRSTNLVSTSTQGHLHTYLHDKDTEVVTLISQSSVGSVGNADSWSPRISDDGKIVVFVSTASNLDEQVSVEGGVSNVFSRNIATGETRVLSVSALINDASANANSFDPVIDGDGRNIVFSSEANDLTINDKTQAAHLYHFTSLNNTINVIPTTSDALPEILMNARASANAISSDGQFVFYELDLPGTSPSLYRLSLGTLIQQPLELTAKSADVPWPEK
ncbi:hypothetical protein N9850_03810 [Granulosicoccus sp.]|nr:hypothetical protein [Granulosicoccus sp.]MDB4222873.1 hypothetical protein [Granulosicoccus sp.]